MKDRSQSFKNNSIRLIITTKIGIKKNWKQTPWPQPRILATTKINSKSGNVIETMCKNCKKICNFRLCLQVQGSITSSELTPHDGWIAPPYVVTMQVSIRGERGSYPGERCAPISCKIVVLMLDEKQKENHWSLCCVKWGSQKGQMGAGIDHWQLGFCYWEWKIRVLGVNGICIIRGYQALVQLKIPHIKYFMRSSCAPGHCFVRVRTFLMLTELFFNLKAPYLLTTSLSL